MTSIRRTALRTLLGLTAAISVGLIGASAAAAQSIDETSPTVVLHPSDSTWP